MLSSQDTPRDATPPVQLELSYQSADALVTAYTASVSKGGFVFMSDKALAVGRRFEFHLKVEDEPQPVTLMGLVVRSKVVGKQHQVAVQYLPAESSRLALGRLLARMRVKPLSSLVRQEPRIPVNLIARDALLPTRTLVIENLSHGGMGVSLTRGAELHQLGQGVPCGLEVRLHSGAAVILRGRVAWVCRDARGAGARFGVCFANLGESEHLIIAGLLQLFRPQSLLLGVGEECMALLSSTPIPQGVDFDVDELIELISSELRRFLDEMTGQPCHVARRPLGAEEPTTAGPLKLSADLAGDVDIELTLYAERTALELLARGAGFDDAGPEAVYDSGLEVMSTLAGHVADQMERLNLREEVLPHRSGEPLSARRPFDRRELFDVWIGAESMLLEALLRLQTVLHADFPEASPSGRSATMRPEMGRAAR